MLRQGRRASIGWSPGDPHCSLAALLVLIFGDDVASEKFPLVPEFMPLSPKGAESIPFEPTGEAVTNSVLQFAISIPFVNPPAPAQGAAGQ